MDEYTTEGISTTSQSQVPEDVLQDPHFFECFSNLPMNPMNDPGLTLPPGSPLQQSGEYDDTSRPLLGCDYEDPILARILAGEIDALDILGRVDDSQGEGRLKNNGVTDQNNTDETTYHPTIRDDDSAQVADELRNDPIFQSVDSLFNPVRVLGDLNFESGLTPRKRVGDDAFPDVRDVWGPPLKRRVLDLQSSNGALSSATTPSLTSHDSSHQCERGQGESVGSPASIDRLQTTDAESLFGEPEPDISSNEHNVSGQAERVDCIDKLADECVGTPSLSKNTVQRFNLVGEDIKRNIDRETTQYINSKPEYISPYPKHNEPLGYFPSCAALHVKYTEVSSPTLSRRLNDLRDKAKKASNERNEYKIERDEYMKELSQARNARKENPTLRRNCSNQRKKMDQLSREIDQWKERFSQLGTTYNNLVAYMANEPKRRAFDFQCGINYVLHNQRMQMQQGGNVPITKTTTSTSQPEMVDLTDDNDTGGNGEGNAQKRMELLRSMRKKPYDWMKSAEQQQQQQGHTDKRNNPQTRQELDDSGTGHDHGHENNHNSTNANANTNTKTDNATHINANTNTNENESEDDLFNIMLEELAKG